MYLFFFPTEIPSYKSEESIFLILKYKLYAYIIVIDDICPLSSYRIFMKINWQVAQAPCLYPSTVVYYISWFHFDLDWLFRIISIAISIEEITISQSTN